MKMLTTIVTAGSLAFVGIATPANAHGFRAGFGGGFFPFPFFPPVYSPPQPPPAYYPPPQSYQPTPPVYKEPPQSYQQPQPQQPSYAPAVQPLSPDETKGVQDMLNALYGLNLEVDGVLGPATRQAIQTYQSNNGLVVTGNLDKPTLAMLILEARRLTKQPQEAPTSAPLPSNNNMINADRG
jgi:hypothetical protein